MRSITLLALAVKACFVVAAASKPDVDVTVKFPDANPFGRVTNGQSSNLLHVRLANHAGEEIVITKVHGQFREADGRQRALRNTTSLQLQQPVLPGLASPLIPYKFHSENKNGEVGLRVWVDYLDAGKKLHTVLGYEGSVTVIEPPTNWFDPELLFLYLILSGVFGAIGYWAYTTYLIPAASATKKRAKKVPSTPKPVVPVTPASPGEEKKAYEEEWIPEHVLRARKVAEKKLARGGYTSATSGEESEGGTKKGKKGKK